MLLSIPLHSPPHAFSSAFIHSRFRTHLSSRRLNVIVSSIKKKSRFGVKDKAERSVKSNAEICAEIRDFVAMAGFPEGHVPSLKDLLDHGRKDLANVVRRKGYKLITELLMNSTNEGATTRSISTTTKEASNDREVVGKDQDQKLEEFAEDSSLGSFTPSTLPPPSRKASTTSIKNGDLFPLLELKGIYDQWIVVIEKPPGSELTEEELEIHYEQTLTKVINRDQNVRELIHKISYKHPFGFGCKIDLETAIKLQEMPGVIFVSPDPFVVQDVATEKIFTVENYKGFFDSVMEDYDQRASGADLAASVLLGIITWLYNTPALSLKSAEKTKKFDEYIKIILLVIVTFYESQMVIMKYEKKYKIKLRDAFSKNGASRKKRFLVTIILALTLSVTNRILGSPLSLSPVDIIWVVPLVGWLNDLFKAATS